MDIFLIIAACVLWLASFRFLTGRQILSPALSYAALVLLSLANRNGYPLLPLNATILTGWFFMTLVVTFIILLQPEAVRRQTRGTAYILVGAIAGLALGLLGFSFVKGLGMLYSVMIIGIVVGIFLGFLLYTRTPEGTPVAPGSGNFFRYLLAKGFPAAITVMQAGVALVLTLAIYRMG